MYSSQRKAEFYSAIVWVLAGISLVIYGTLGVLNTTLPGVEELVVFLSKVEGKQIYVAAFISILVEGLYFIGSFFPGSTLVVIVAILSQLSGITVFIGTILSIFIGWCLAGAINIFLAKTYFYRIARLQENNEYEVKDKLWATWFPAFRANYEVAQVTEGGNPIKVFLSSVRVKFWSSVAAAVCLFAISFFLDIKDVSNEEGYFSVIIIALISFAVGFLKLKKYFLEKK